MSYSSHSPNVDRFLQILPPNPFFYNATLRSRAGRSAASGLGSGSEGPPNLKRDDNGRSGHNGWAAALALTEALRETEFFPFLPQDLPYSLTPTRTTELTRT